MLKNPGGSLETVSLTIRNIPARIMEEIRARARANHRSVQGEVLATLEAATQPGKLSIKEAARARARAWAAIARPVRRDDPRGP
jgi:plasmid stability protein